LIEKASATRFSKQIRFPAILRLLEMEEQMKKSQFGARARGPRCALMIVAPIFLVSASCVQAAPQNRPSSVPPAARRTIAEANAAWLRASKQEDAAAMAEPYADDGVFVTATGEVVRGRAAIAQLMRERFAKEGHAIDGKIVQDGLMRAGGMIYEWGHVELQLARDASKPVGLKGRYLTVWAVDDAGRWRIVRNLSLPD
jgi:uncharacterized protein (TIGR02246 family)